MIQTPPFHVSSSNCPSHAPPGVRAWNQTQYDILQTLAIRVRLMAVQQVERIWNIESQSNVEIQECLGRLIEARLLDHYNINAHPLLTPRKAIAVWAPGAAEPNWRDVSNAARSRWTKPSISLEVLVATKRTANLFGGSSHGLPPLEHRDHDLLLSDVYVAYRSNQTKSAMRWIGEDFLPKAGYQIKDPDAFLIDDDGHPMRVIESAGRYSRKQVESFHDHCLALQLPYELW